MKKAIISLIICAVVALSAVCFSGCDVGATLNGWVTYITNAITGKGNDQSDNNQTEEPDDGNQTEEPDDGNQTEETHPDDNNNPDETGVLSAPFINVDTQYAGENYCNLIVNITGGAHANIYYVHLNYNGMDMPVRTANSNTYNLGVSSANAGTYIIYVVASDSTGKYRDSAASETVTVTLFE